MTLKVRRILSLIFIILFFAITPAIVLYAAGYKFKKNSFSIERTGMLVIESKPKGAKIFLNGKVRKNIIGSIFNKNSFITTPAKISNLTPGEYDLTLETEGHFSWKKKLSINPGSTVYVKNVYLLKSYLPTKIIDAKIEKINFSPDRNEALILSSDQAVFLNLADETTKISKQNNLEGKKIIWSLSGQKLLVGNNLFDTGDLSKKINLDELTPGAFNYKWSNNTLFYQDKSSIYLLDEKNLQKKIASDPSFNDFLIKGGYLYLVKQSKEAAYIEIIDLATNARIRDIGLPVQADYSFINSQHSFCNLYDSGRSTLYLISHSGAYYPPLAEIINNVKMALWYDENNLLYINDFEIWLYNLDSKNKTLITRISSPVEYAIMHPNKRYIVYSTAQTINAIELDDNERKNIYELVKFDAIGSLSFNSNGNTLFFAGRIGKSEGLYKLEIQ